MSNAELLVEWREKDLVNFLPTRYIFGLLKLIICMVIFSVIFSGFNNDDHFKLNITFETLTKAEKCRERVIAAN